MSTLKVPVTPHDHILGSDGALVTLVEYGDYECPYCAAAQPVLKQIQLHFAHDNPYGIATLETDIAQTMLSAVGNDRRQGGRPAPEARSWLA
jgi:hypothetical protein